ncbi:MAG: hypothetical protein WDM88_02620 [Galbitalea sp.]
MHLSHPLFAEVLIAGMSPASLDARRIEAARRSGGGSDDTARFRVDALLAETSEPPPAAEMTWAARYAYSLTDHVLALRLATLALAQESSFDTLLVRAAALSSMKSAEAAGALAEAQAAAGSDREVAMIAREWARHDAIASERPLEAIRRETTALDSLTDPQARSLLEDDIATWRLIVGEGPFAEPRRPDEEPADPLALLGSIAYEVMYAAQSSEFSRARAAIDRARPLSELERLSFPLGEQHPRPVRIPGDRVREGVGRRADLRRTPPAGELE